MAGKASNKQPATSNKQPATSNKQPATSNKQPATSNKQQATSNKQPATHFPERKVHTPAETVILSVQHVEFFHRDHFEHRYHRRPAPKSLSRFIDFYWETDFNELFKKYPEGFSDALFPNVGYTYLINLGTPFVMQLEDDRFEMKSDGFLPRHVNMICHHAPGNRIFGIKFRVSPVLFEKKVNFSEYRDYIFPLSYLIDRKIIEAVKKAGTFEQRVQVISQYYQGIIEKHHEALKPVAIVTRILENCDATNRFDESVEALAAAYGISARTLQRYFEATTSITSKQALQIMRIRKAIAHLASEPETFHYSLYGYYDYSHFYKHLRSFVGRHSIDIVKPHLKLLKQAMPKDNSAKK